MRIRYIGGRSRYEVDFNRRSFNFNPENGMTIETDDRDVINYIFRLPNNFEFEVFENVPSIEDEKSEIEEARKPGRPKKEKKNG